MTGADVGASLGTCGRCHRVQLCPALTPERAGARLAHASRPPHAGTGRGATSRSPRKVRSSRRFGEERRDWACPRTGAVVRLLPLGSAPSIPNSTHWTPRRPGAARGVPTQTSDVSPLPPFTPPLCHAGQREGGTPRETTGRGPREPLGDTGRGASAEVGTLTALAGSPPEGRRVACAGLSASTVPAGTEPRPPARGRPDPEPHSAAVSVQAAARHCPDGPSWGQTVRRRPRVTLRSGSS